MSQALLTPARHRRQCAAMRAAIILALGLLAAGGAAAGVAAACGATETAAYAWRILRVIDGDTVEVRMPGLPAALAVRAVRLDGIDAPETGGRAACDSERTRGAAAAAFTRRAVQSGRVVFAPRGWDSFGRVLATVTAGGTDVGAALVAAGLAREWDGRGPSPDWCGGG